MSLLLKGRSSYRTRAYGATQMFACFFYLLVDVCIARLLVCTRLSQHTPCRSIAQTCNPLPSDAHDGPRRCLRHPPAESQNNGLESALAAYQAHSRLFSHSDLLFGVLGCPSMARPKKSMVFTRLCAVRFVCDFGRYLPKIIILYWRKNCHSL